MTRFVLVISLVFAVILFAFLPIFLPPDGATPQLTFTPDQAESFRQLELGYASERHGLLAEAQEAYGEAALADDSALAQIARERFVFVGELRANPLYRAQKALRDPLVLLPMLLVLVGLAITFAPRPPTYAIAPFQDLTGSDSGKAFHLFVARAWENTRNVFQKAQEKQRIDVPSAPLREQQSPESTRKLLAMLGEQTLGPITISIDKSAALLETLSAWNLYRLTGHLYAHNGKLYAEAVVLHGERQEAAWYHEAAAQEWEWLAEQLAYRFMAHTLRSKIHFQDWEAFAVWCQALGALQEATPDPVRLEAIAGQLEKAAAMETAAASRDLAFQLGEVYKKLGQYQKASQAYARVIQR